MWAEAEEGSRESHLMAFARQHLCTNCLVSRFTPSQEYIALQIVVLHLLRQTVFNEVKVEVAFPLNVNGHHSAGGGEGAVVTAGRLHHVAKPEDVAELGPGIAGVVGAHRVVDQVVAMILVTEIRKPDISVVRKPTRQQSCQIRD